MVIGLVDQKINKVYQFLRANPWHGSTLDDVDTYVAFHIFHEMRQNKLNVIFDF